MIEMPPLEDSPQPPEYSVDDDFTSLFRESLRLGQDFVTHHRYYPTMDYLANV
jgi:hypothetical protein